jgi:hypothetical protein
MKPNAEVIDNLLPAFCPCPGFESSCTCMRWNPREGHIPRGFCGAVRAPADVKLVLVTAEPGDPYPGQHYEDSGTAEERLDGVCRQTWEYFAHGRDLFHRNLRKILDLCWPGLSFREQMEKTWITDSVLCSAETEGGFVPRIVVRECTSRYLKRQLIIFPNAQIIALGKKAQSRLGQAGINDFLSAFSAAPPGCNYKGAERSWQVIASKLNGS